MNNFIKTAREQEVMEVDKFQARSEWLVFSSNIEGHKVDHTNWKGCVTPAC